MGILELFKKKSSGDVAKDRLKLLLVTDRANCSPEIMEQIKNDIIKVIQKYMDIDCEGLEINLTQTESEGKNGVVPALIANIPIKEVKHNDAKTEEKKTEEKKADDKASKEKSDDKNSKEKESKDSKSKGNKGK